MTDTSLADFLLQNASNVEAVQHSLTLPKSKHPKGWEPGVTWDGGAGVAVSKPVLHDGTEVDHAQLLVEWGFDPALYAIDGPLEYRQWDAAIGEGQVQTMRYYKAKIVPRAAVNFASLPDLVKSVQGHKKLKKAAPTGEDSFVVALADWQLGKTDIGGTSQDTVNRILAMIDQVEDRVRELRKAGRGLGTLYVLGLGDMIERCSGFYANQEFVTDLTEQEQQELAVHLILKAIKQWSALFEKVVVACIVGNHGENRGPNNKANTDRIRDNADTGVFKTAALVLNENPDRYGHVSFMIPSDRSTMSLNISGITVGIAHGNQYGSAPTALKKWWEGQTLGYQPIADATILVTGHYHHLKVDQYGPRTHIQCPAMDPGSRWFSEGSGMESPSGTVTFVVSEETGWSDLQVVAQ
jgi:predicted phosphodiesterase